MIGYFRIFVIIGIFIISIFLFCRDFNSKAQQFTWQTQGFLHGRVDVAAPHATDMAIHNGQYYWPQGPFPSIILMPFVLALGDSAKQGHAQAILILVFIVQMYNKIIAMRFSSEDSMYFLATFLFGTVYFGLMIQPSSWNFSQIISVLFLFQLLFEWQSTRRPLILGIYFSTLLATRPTASLFGVYILFAFVSQLRAGRSGLRPVLLYVTPVFITLSLLLVFNAIRFDSALNNGYLTNLVAPQAHVLREIGLFHIKHIPMNIYWYFIAGLKAVTDGSAHLIFPYIRYNEWGLSVAIISPFFYWMFRSLCDPDTESRALWITLCATVCILMTYYSTGWMSFGPRYIADALPIAFILLLRSFKKESLSAFHKNSIVLSAAFNAYIIAATRLLT